jgi:hypothetical protein
MTLSNPADTFEIRRLAVPIMPHGAAAEGFRMLP